MSDVTFPTFAGQPGIKWETMKITGTDVSSSAQSSAGLDLRGKFFATAQKAANVVTIEFLQSYADVIIIPIPLTANVGVDLSSITGSGFVYTTTERDDNTTPVNNADIAFLVITFNTTAAFS